MIELHVVVSEVLSHALVPVVQMKVDALPKYERPWYLPAPAEPVRDLAEGRAQMADLARRYPRNVKGFGPEGS
jgi:hypothetical protein